MEWCCSPSLMFVLFLLCSANWRSWKKSQVRVAWFPGMFVSTLPDCGSLSSMHTCKGTCSWYSFTNPYFFLTFCLNYLEWTSCFHRDATSATIFQLEIERKPYIFRRKVTLLTKFQFMFSFVFLLCGLWVSLGFVVRTPFLALASCAVSHFGTSLFLLVFLSWQQHCCFCEAIGGRLLLQVDWGNFWRNGLGERVREES